MASPADPIIEKNEETPPVAAPSKQASAPPAPSATSQAATPEPVSPEPDEKKPQQSKPESNAPASVAGGVQVSAGEIKAGEFTITDRKISSQEYQEITNYYLSDVSGKSIRPFSVNDAWCISEEKEEEIEQLYVADQEEIGMMLRRLSEKRLMILSGEPRTGKATTAVYLGKQLIERMDIEVATKPTYLIPAMDPQVRIDLREIAANNQDYNGRLVIFRDAFARQNLDLIGFFSRIDDFGLAELSHGLQKNSSFLIFTTTPSEISSFKSRLTDHDLHHELNPLHESLLAQGLEQKLAHIAGTQQADLKRMESLKQQQQFLISRLKTMPRIARFIEYYLHNAFAETSLDEAVRRFEDLAYWFLSDLPGDFDAWCFALSLTLAHCQKGSHGIAWFDFEHLRRAISQCLKNDPELFQQKSGFRDPSIRESAERSPVLSEDFFLERCRAEIVKEPNSLEDVIRFKDESYSQRLWEILLKHHRGILLNILPNLREIAENYAISPDSHSRALAAQIIGRIGEMSPYRITFNFMNHWIQSSDNRHCATVGALYQGILSSENEHYRERCLESLSALAALSETNQVEEKVRLLTAIAAYSQLGYYDLDLALRGLKQIAERQLAPVMQDVQRITRLIKRVENEFSKQLSVDEAVDLLVYHKLLQDLAERLFSEQGGVFLGIQHAIFSVCLYADPVQVFRELREWASASNQTIGALVSLIFLINGGVASRLETVRIEMPISETNSSETKTFCNPIVISLATNQESIRQMARFLAVIYESFSSSFALPADSQRFFRESFFQHLKTWVKDAQPIESCRAAMASLFVEMMRVHQGKLYDPIYQLLRGKEFSQADSEMKSFAETVFASRAKA